MVEQYGDVPPPTANAPADTSKNPPAVRPTELSPAEISQSRQQGAAMDGELSAIRNKLNRIMGKPEWNAKQFNTACALIAAHESIVNPGWREELAELFPSEE